MQEMAERGDPGVAPDDSVSPRAADVASPSGRNIVVCCDGTSNSVANDPTNVLRIFRSMERSDRQVVFYDSGVGALADPTKFTVFSQRFSRTLDQGIAHSVRENVCTAYRFLAKTYRPGDRIFLFGFSRGAYTVRALAGMIHSLGLVRPESEHLDRLAWAVFANDYDNLTISERLHFGNRFKSAFGFPVKIHFVGVWDTVSSFGSPWGLRSVPYTANNPSIQHVRHAVSIDEHRACFQSNLFYPDQPSQHVSYRQLWFAGSHGDVGGGYPEDDNGLAKIPLQWMIAQAEACGCWFDSDGKNQFLGRSPAHKDISKPDPLAVAHNSTRGWWHLLEFLPRRQWDGASLRIRWFGPNLYRRRLIPENAIFHRSVQEKMDGDPTYRPSNMPKAFTFEE